MELVERLKTFQMRVADPCARTGASRRTAARTSREPGIGVAHGFTPRGPPHPHQTRLAGLIGSPSRGSGPTGPRQQTTPGTRRFGRLSSPPRAETCFRLVRAAPPRPRQILAALAQTQHTDEPYFVQDRQKPRSPGSLTGKGYGANPKPFQVWRSPCLLSLPRHHNLPAATCGCKTFTLDETRLRV